VELPGLDGAVPAAPVPAPQPAGAQVAVERAWVIPSFGIFLLGWSIDPKREIARLQVVSDFDGPLADLAAAWDRLPRMDVSKIFSEVTSPSDDLGFVALVRDDRLEHVAPGSALKVVASVGDGEISAQMVLEEIPNLQDFSAVATGIVPSSHPRFQAIMD